MSSTQVESWDLALEYQFSLESENAGYADLILDTGSDDRLYEPPSREERESIVDEDVPYYWAGQLPNSPFVFATGERIRMLRKTPAENPWSAIASSLNMSIPSAQLKYRFYFERLQARTRFDEIIAQSTSGTEGTPVLEAIEDLAKHLYRDRGWKKADVYGVIIHYVEQFDWMRRRHEVGKEGLWDNDDEMVCRLAQRVWLKWKSANGIGSVESPGSSHPTSPRSPQRPQSPSPRRPRSPRPSH